MTYNCDQCTGSFTLKRYLVLHKKYVHLKIRPYKCNVCEKSFPTMQKLSSHEISHNKTKSAIYTCDQCPGTFTLKESVGRHKKTVHQKILPHKCNICDKSFANMSKLKRHKISHDNTDKTNSFKCKQCEKVYNISDNLRRHIRNNHEKIRNHACEKCPLTYDNSTDLNYHVDRVHNRITKFKCDFCDKRFFTNPELIRHKQANHEGKKTC